MRAYIFNFARCFFSTSTRSSEKASSTRSSEKTRKILESDFAVKRKTAVDYYNECIIQEKARHKEHYKNYEDASASARS
jgi:hypothetical protein